MSKPQVILDLECYPGFFLVCFYRADVDKHKAFALHSDNPKLDNEGILKIFKDYEIITFNGNHYDIPLLSYALTGATTEDLKGMSDAIIVDQIKHWVLEKSLKFKTMECDHIDIKELCIGKSSLKIYGGRLHLPVMRDLPLPPDTLITPEMREEITTYCINDLRVTAALAAHLKPQIDLRREMSERYGVDLRSKSDAQIAEAVIKAEVFRLSGKEVKKKNITGKQRFKYDPPDYIRFDTPELQQILEDVKSAEFFVKDNGQIQEPEVLTRTVKFGGTEFQLGQGGVHSQEESCFHVEDDNYIIRDFDVLSFYPITIINQGLVPPAVGEDFKEVFKSIVDRRVEAKKVKDAVTDKVLKIVINGTFGKTNSIYSFLYAPKMMIQTTVTGQLALCMLAERMYKYGIQPISANTDGLVLYCPRDKEKVMLHIVKLWETHTGFTMEETQYKALYNRDVNTYIAFKPDGKVKTKGLFAEPSIAKNPQNEICSMAVIEYLKSGKPYEETIRECKDIRKFITLRNIKGGGQKNGEIFTKNVRWYYTTEDNEPIRYLSNGNSVAGSRGGKACMNLPETLPDDIDYDRYIKIAKKMLISVGVLPKPAKLPRKNTKVWKELLATGKIEEVDDGVYEWVEV